MLKVGDKVYVIIHAYHHYLAEVAEVLGKARASFRNVVKVHGCARSWTEFFADGVGTDTDMDWVGDIVDTGYILCHAWPHEIPARRATPARRRR